MIYINQLGCTSLGWGETKDQAFEHASYFFPDLHWGEIKDFTNINGECYWSETPEGEA